ncbi:MAG: hypothetical protein RMJ35_10010, partial [Phycisphaerales bacterium]|nr:hypothetical protein [Phycisphaerales bacterium]
MRGKEGLDSSSMDSRQIRPNQAERLCQALRPPLAYLGRLRRRMELLGFPPDDPLYRTAARAFEAVQDLYVQSHYLTCPHGVGRRPTAAGGFGNHGPDGLCSMP